MRLRTRLRFVGGLPALSLLAVAVAGFFVGHPAVLARAPHRTLLRAAGPRLQPAKATRGHDCAACHTSEGWSVTGGEGAGFEHRRTGFPLTGQHRALSCNACHKPGVKVRRACASCHQDAHQGRLSQGCDDCHRATQWSDVDAIALHRRTRLPLTGMHALAECTACHQRGGVRRLSAVPSACFACHEQAYRDPSVHPPHTGGSGRAPFSRRCETCHQTLAWSPAFLPAATLDLPDASLSGRLASRHALRFPTRAGAHAGFACADCHPHPQRPQRAQCVGCHAPQQLAVQHPGEALPRDARGCLRCHRGGR